MNGSLTSIDIDRECSDNLAACLENENNTNPIKVICADAITHDFDKKFDLVTMVGSAVAESGKTKAIIAKAISLIKENGALYLQILHKDTDFDIDAFCGEHNVRIDKRLVDDKYGIHCEYYKIKKC